MKWDSEQPVQEVIPQKLSKAAKRRLKKEEEEKANQARIAAAIKESEAAFMSRDPHDLKQLRFFNFFSKGN